MISNPGKKVTCQAFLGEWIMFDGRKFVFEDGVEPDAYWWRIAQGFNTEFWELKEKKQCHSERSEESVNINLKI